MMQAVQLQQLVPQLQQQATSQQTPQSDSTFLQELKARLSEAEEKSPDAATSPQALHTPNEGEATAAIAEKSTDTTDKKLQKKATDKATDAASDTVLAARGDVVPTPEGGPVVVPTITEVDSVSLVRVDGSSAEEALTTQHIAWLFTEEPTGAESDIAVAVSGDITEDGLSTLLANAEEFVPGSESEALALAQNLSANDPALFLERAERIADVEALSATAAPLVTGSELQAAAATEGSRTAATAAKEKKSPFRFEIHDLRSEQVASDAATLKTDTYVQRLTDRKEFNANYARQNSEANQVTMELSAKAAVAENITASSTQAAGAASSTFQSMLANAVQENAPDFVRAGSIVLKDNNQGAINLILHPESLGNVKVQLSLSDKVITGQITVHSEEAYQAFKESIDSIKQAFAQSGFDTGSFDLNFAGNSNSFAQGNASEQQQQSAFRAKATYGDFITPNQTGENAEHAYARSSLYAVDIVA